MTSCEERSKTRMEKKGGKKKGTGLELPTLGDARQYVEMKGRAQYWKLCDHTHTYTHQQGITSPTIPNVVTLAIKSAPIIRRPQLDPEDKRLCRHVRSPQVEVVLGVVQPQPDGHGVPLPALCEDVIHGYAAGRLS